MFKVEIQSKSMIINLRKVKNHQTQFLSAKVNHYWATIRCQTMLKTRKANNQEAIYPSPLKPMLVTPLLITWPFTKSKAEISKQCGKSFSALIWSGRSLKHINFWAICSWYLAWSYLQFISWNGAMENLDQKQETHRINRAFTTAYLGHISNKAISSYQSTLTVQN